jgi:membrane protease YdiL (CAAX protease family)
LGLARAHAMARDRLRQAQQLDRHRDGGHGFRVRVQIPDEGDRDATTWCSPINQAFHYLAGNRAALPAAIYVMIVVAGFGEETVFRGYLIERFRKLFGTSVWANTSIVLLTSAWFGLAHYSLQGVPGVAQATIFGLVFGTIFAVTGWLWMLMIAHAAFDLTALAIIYWNLESKKVST